MRMYFLAMYNLSGIQKGIQSGHAVEQYAFKYGQDEDYRDYVQNHKTWIILDGGGSADMVNHLNTLTGAGIKLAYFEEPDLNNSVSAICFLVPERVYSPKPIESPMEALGVLLQEPVFGGDLWFTSFIKQFTLARN